jgi:hypothetical protein
MIGVKKRKKNYLEICKLYEPRVYTISKEKLIRIFYVPTHLNIFQCVGTPDDTKNIQTIFDFCSRVLKYIMGYRSHRVLYTGFRLLKVIVFDVVDEILRITP